MKRGTAAVGYLDPGTWSAVFGLSYRDLILHDLAHERRLFGTSSELRHVTGSGGIATGRNKVAQTFLDATEAEWLWFVDSDMGFAPDTLDRLIASADEHQRPVMGGLCFAQKKAPGAEGEFRAPRFVITPTLYEYREAEGEVGFLPVPDYQRDAVQQVAATGAACVLIHRRVLRKIRAKSGDVWFDPITHPGIGDNPKPRTFSEDLSFCVRLAALGEPVHVDTRVRTTHDKHGIYLDEQTFDQDRALARLAAELNAEEVA